MTREEAIAILEVSKHMATSGRLYNQAIDMAIEALQEPSEHKLNNHCNSLLTDDSDDSKEQKSKLDLISRADAIGAVDSIKSTDNWQGAVIALLSALPSADAVSKGVLEQFRWERDVAMAQLEEYGIPFGTDKDEDMVRIVRCKDCRHRYEEGDNTHYYWCRLNDIPIDDTDFCSWGERGEP